MNRRTGILLRVGTRPGISSQHALYLSSLLLCGLCALCGETRRMSHNLTPCEAGGHAHAFGTGIAKLARAECR